MANILVICEDNTVFDELIQTFSTIGFNFEKVNSWTKALEYLDNGPSDFIFLFNEKINKISEVLEKISDSPYKDVIPVFCFTELLTADERLSLYQNGAFEVITLPILTDELIMLFNRYGFSSDKELESMQAGMMGRLSDIGIIDLIQILEEGNKTAILKLKRNSTTGKILFQEGQIYSADYRKFSGLSAFLNIVGWLRGEFQVEFTDEEFERKIELDNQQLLFEAIQRIDARAEFLKQLPPVDDVLLISPDTDIFKLNDNDFRFIKFFQGGNTIYNYLLNFDLDELKLLEKVLFFFNKKMLLTREQFDSHITEYEAEIQKKSLKGTLKRLLNKKDNSKNRSQKSKKKRVEKSKTDSQINESQILDYVAINDIKILNEFKQKIAEL